MKPASVTEIMTDLELAVKDAITSAETELKAITTGLLTSVSASKEATAALNELNSVITALHNEFTSGAIHDMFDKVKTDAMASYDKIDEFLKSVTSKL